MLFALAFCERHIFLNRILLKRWRGSPGGHGDGREEKDSEAREAEKSPADQEGMKAEDICTILLNSSNIQLPWDVRVEDGGGHHARQRGAVSLTT